MSAADDDTVAQTYIDMHDDLHQPRGVRIHLDFDTTADARKAATAFRLFDHTVIDNGTELIITRG